MTISSLFYWLALNRVAEVGPVTFVRLLDHFGDPEKIFKAKSDELCQVAGLSVEARQNILKFSSHAAVEQECKTLKQQGMTVLTYKDPDYPPRLQEIYGFPPILYVWGKLQHLQARDWLGVVGSRDITEYGMMVVRRVVRELAENKIGIVSGFARGVDIEAHTTCMDAGYLTIGVLGSGFNHITPFSNRRYIKNMVEKGCLLSEFPPDCQPRPEFFPRRNRLISGMARGVLVVEADEKSGALITAQYAMEQNRDVYAIPGSIFSPRSRGCHRLIAQGAKVTCQAADILADWQYPARSKSGPSFVSQDEEKIHTICREKSVTPDVLVQLTGLATERVTMLLTKMELDGKIRNLPGQRYSAL